jgi:hypothetical protein
LGLRWGFETASKPFQRNVHINNNHLFLKEKAAVQFIGPILHAAIHKSAWTTASIFFILEPKAHRQISRPYKGHKAPSQFERPLSGDSRSGSSSLEDRPDGLEAGNNQNFSSSEALLK